MKLIIVLPYILAAIVVYNAAAKFIKLEFSTKILIKYKNTIHLFR